MVWTFVPILFCTLLVAAAVLGARNEVDGLHRQIAEIERQITHDVFVVSERHRQLVYHVQDLTEAIEGPCPRCGGGRVGVFCAKCGSQREKHAGT